MNEEIRLPMSNVNTSIIQIRAAYAMWAKVRGLNYHEVLIFYAMRDNEECTQKKIADSYRLPKQTVNNIITSLKKDGYLTLIPGRKTRRKRSLPSPKAEKPTTVRSWNPYWNLRRLPPKKWEKKRSAR